MKDQKIRALAVVKNIYTSDLSSTTSYAMPDFLSMTQVDPLCFLLLAYLMSSERYSAAHMYFRVFCFLFQLSMYHVDHIASISR